MLLVRHVAIREQVCEWRWHQPGGRRYLFPAFGKKAHAVTKVVKGPITTMNPASAFRRHPKAAVTTSELEMKSHC